MASRARTGVAAILTGALLFGACVGLGVAVSRSKPRDLPQAAATGV